MGAALALVMSLIAPGAGHILTGHVWQGVLLGGLFALGKNALLPLVLRVCGVQTLKQTLYIFYAFNWGYVGLILYAVISAFWYGLQAQEIWFLRAVLSAVAVILVYKNTKSKIIFTALCGRSGVFELMQKMRKSPMEKNGR